MTSKIVTGLWIGSSLPPLAELCIRSFQDHGFSFQLLAYEKPANTPNDTVIIDAREILPKDELFTHCTGSLAPTADRIRYHYLAQFGGIWTDMDVVCLRPFEAATHPWFGLQEPGLANLAVLHFPKGHGVMVAMETQMADPAAPMPWDSAKEILHKQEWRATWPDLRHRRVHAEWGLGGPEGFTRALKHFGIFGQAVAPHTFNPIPYTAWRWAFNGTIQEESEALRNSLAVHLWGELLRREPDAFEFLSHQSLVAQLMRKHDCDHLREKRPVSINFQRPQKILIGICSSRATPERRTAIRQTWLASPHPEIHTLFFVGGADTIDESDTVVVEARDDYDFLPQKVLAFFRYAVENLEFDWLFKCDDDTYVSLDRLKQLPKPGYGIIGSEYLAQRGSPSGGAGYFLDRATVERLVLDRSIPDTGFEDVLIGEAAIRGGAKPLATHRLRMNAVQIPLRNNDIATAHWCSPKLLHTIHAILHDEEGCTIRAIHPYWSDEIILYSGGYFQRFSTGCSGKWERLNNDHLRLEWTDWDPEVFAKTATASESDIYQLLVERIGGENGEEFHDQFNTDSDSPPAQVTFREPVKTRIFYAEHAYWKDYLILSKSGKFKRLSRPCAGTWTEAVTGILSLNWYEWDRNILAEDNGAYRCDFLSLRPAKGKFLSYFESQDEILFSDRKSTVEKKGHWAGAIEQHHYFDHDLAEAICSDLSAANCNTVADLGCGMGYYVAFLRSNGFTATGIDGCPSTAEVTMGTCQWGDLSEPADLAFHDAVISLEVGEHIPRSYEDAFLRNIASCAKHTIILSWAIPGQGGHGHINERSNTYIEEKMSSLGFIREPIREEILRKQAGLWWFQKSLMVFSRHNKAGFHNIT